MLPKSAFPLHGLWLVLTLLLVGPVPNAEAGSDTGRPDPEQGPTQVKVDLFLLDLDAVDSANQSFDANVYFEASWRDPRLADRSLKGSRTLALGEIWNPRLQILNQQRLWATLPDEVEVRPDGTVIQRARVWGSFSQPLDLRKFPFDTQWIAVTVVSAGYGAAEVTIIPGAMSGIAKQLSVPDWRILEWRITTDVTIPGPEGVEEDSGVELLLVAERLKGHYWIKVIAPLILIVAMSWAVFWIDPKELGTKISITITAMLTLIAYRFAIGVSLPQVSYLTRMDWFILLSTILVYASLIAVIVTAAYERKGDSALAQRIDRASRWGFPLFFLFAWGFIAVVA